MKQNTRNGTHLTVGMDLSDRTTQICVLDAGGEIIEETRLNLTDPVVRRRFQQLPPSRVALDVGTHSPWVSRLLLECEHEVLVANPRQVALIARSDRKSDRTDAESLARIARVDPRLLSPTHHRGPEAQAELAQIRSRDALVRARTKLVNHVRGAVQSMGARLPEGLRPAPVPLLQTIGDLTLRIRQFDRGLARPAAARYPETAVLQQVLGVGPLTSLTFVLTLEDPQRFAKSRAVGAFLGLRPRQRDSGAEQLQLRITKAGDVLLRRLAVLLHWLWVTGAVYEPLRLASARLPEASRSRVASSRGSFTSRRGGSNRLEEIPPNRPVRATATCSLGREPEADAPEPTTSWWKRQRLAATDPSMHRARSRLTKSADGSMADG